MPGRDIIQMSLRHQIVVDQLDRHGAHKEKDEIGENSACVHAEARAPLFCRVAASKKLEALHSASFFPDPYAWLCSAQTRSR